MIASLNFLGFGKYEYCRRGTGRSGLQPKFVMAVTGVVTGPNAIAEALAKRLGECECESAA